MKNIKVLTKQTSHDSVFFCFLLFFFLFFVPDAFNACFSNFLFISLLFFMIFVTIFAWRSSIINKDNSADFVYVLHPMLNNIEHRCESLSLFLHIHLFQTALKPCLLIYTIRYRSLPHWRNNTNVICLTTLVEKKLKWFHSLLLHLCKPWYKLYHQSNQM